MPLFHDVPRLQCISIISIHTIDIGPTSYNQPPLKMGWFKTPHCTIQRAITRAVLRLVWPFDGIVQN